MGVILCVQVKVIMKCSGKGDHEIWYSPVSKINFIVDGKILSRHTANAVMKQAGFSKQF